MERGLGVGRHEVVRERACSSCGKMFTPHVRLKDRQQTCGDKKCRSKRRHQTLKAWRRKNPGHQKKRQHPVGFWKQYRNKNPRSTVRNREQARLRARLKRKSLQRNLDILQAAEFPKKSSAFMGFATLHQSLIVSAFGRKSSG